MPLGFVGFFGVVFGAFAASCPGAGVVGFKVGDQDFGAFGAEPAAGFLVNDERVRHLFTAFAHVHDVASLTPLESQAAMQTVQPGQPLGLICSSVVCQLLAWVHLAQRFGFDGSLSPLSKPAA